MEINSTAPTLYAVRERFSDDVIRGWLDLYGIDVFEDDDDNWWIDNADHEMLLSVSHVRNGHGVWTGIKNETEGWVYANADKMHDILWEFADEVDWNVWEYIEKYGDLKDECSWALESILKNEPADYNLARGIGWLVGNEITWFYQSEAESV